VLLDMRMPNAAGDVVDDAGVEVLYWIEQNRPGLSVVVLTGFGTPANVIETAEFGACAYASKDIRSAQLVTLVRQVAAAAVARLQHVQAALHRDVADARLRQRAMFPTQCRIGGEHPPLTIAGRNVRMAHASGDVFDIVPVPLRNLVAFYLLDVSHHGLGPAMVGSRLSGVFRCGVRRGWSLPELHIQLAQSIFDLSEGTRAVRGVDHLGVYADGVLGCLDIRAQRLDLIRCGVRPPYHRRGTHVELLNLDRTLGDVALGNHAPDDPIPYPATDSLAFRPGDSIVFYTDGVAEINQSERHHLIEQSYAQARFANAQELADTILHSVLVTSNAGFGDAERSGIIFDVADDATVLALAWGPNLT
jgi:serine phosphatase RsbU (regulator of sigma subunit)